MQAPPTWSCSMMAVFRPALAKAAERGPPDCPAPMMITSYRSIPSCTANPPTLPPGEVRGEGKDALPVRPHPPTLPRYARLSQRDRYFSLHRGRQRPNQRRIAVQHVGAHELHPEPFRLLSG